jgi:DNA-binding response OmpR family regulator
MILDPASMTVSHEGVTWELNSQLARLVFAMSAQPGRIWGHKTLLGVMASSASDKRHVTSQIKLVRREFRERGWPDPIKTRRSLGYQWMLPMSAPTPPVAEAVEADEFRFRSTPT